VRWVEPGRRLYTRSLTRSRERAQTDEAGLEPREELTFAASSWTTRRSFAKKAEE